MKKYVLKSGRWLRLGEFVARQLFQRASQDPETLAVFNQCLNLVSEKLGKSPEECFPSYVEWNEEETRIIAEKMER